MDTGDVMAEMLGIAEDRWDECPEWLGEALTKSAKKWYALILHLQRLHVALILDRLHVPPRMAFFLAWRWPWRLLPRFDPDKWRAERSDH